jgi:hypothetical protein
VPSQKNFSFPALLMQTIQSFPHRTVGRILVDTFNPIGLVVRCGINIAVELVPPLKPGRVTILVEDDSAQRVQLAKEFCEKVLIPEFEKIQIFIALFSNVTQEFYRSAEPPFVWDFFRIDAASNRIDRDSLFFRQAPWPSLIYEKNGYRLKVVSFDCNDANHFLEENNEMITKEVQQQIMAHPDFDVEDELVNFALMHRYEKRRKRFLVGYHNLSGSSRVASYSAEGLDRKLRIRWEMSGSVDEAFLYRSTTGLKHSLQELRTEATLVGQGPKGYVEDHLEFGKTYFYTFVRLQNKTSVRDLPKGALVAAMIGLIEPPSTRVEYEFETFQVSVPSEAEVAQRELFAAQERNRPAPVRALTPEEKLKETKQALKHKSLAAKQFAKLAQKLEDQISKMKATEELKAQVMEIVQRSIEVERQKLLE